VPFQTELLTYTCPGRGISSYAWWCSKESGSLPGTSNERHPQIQAPPNSSLLGCHSRHESPEVSQFLLTQDVNSISISTYPLSSSGIQACSKTDIVRI